ncbi:MAG: DUF4126 domain-containing protein [Chlorobiota bacterium]|nr:MAG: DUF4126 domain-containing protein [Chlorobiota bacterium]
MDIILSILIGVGLSAACGYRVFMPMTITSIGSKFGWIHLGQDFSWISTDICLIGFSIAAVLEVGAYYIPILDHALDLVASPLAVIAGMILTASVAFDLPPYMRWTLAVIAGGGIAGLFQGTSVALRGLSTVSTAGVGNNVVSTGETVGAVSISFLAIFIPTLAIIVVIILAFFIIRFIIRKKALINKKT